jgi:hypothetical protein
MGLGLPMLNTASYLHGMQQPTNTSWVDLIPDDSLNRYNSPQLRAEVGVTSIYAYGHGYVAIDIQLLVSLLDGESSCDYKVLWKFLKYGKPSAARMKLWK